jgi:hypothetical protein
MMNARKYIRTVLLVCCSIAIWQPRPGLAQQSSAPSSVVRQSLIRQSLDDAWWTGPMLAPSAAILPHRHFLIEPYLFDVISPHANGIGSLTYMTYGLADRVTVGLIPTFGFNHVSNGPSSSGIKLGDVTAQAQYRLTKFHEGSWVPTTSFNVQETFPTGKYDRLGSRPSDGFGSGAYTTTLSLYSQTYFWLPNRRILRMRCDLSQAFSNTVNVQDVSVYGTSAGFRGHAKPGNSFFVDLAGEYSMTRRWALALDVTYRHNYNTLVTGSSVLDPTIRLNSRSSDAFGFAPAIEYNWKPSMGVLLGTRVIPSSHNTSATITPAVAVNFVH